MHYTLHQLQIFLKVSETCSVTKAAEELHLTQPAVSIQLRNLQEQFDLPLTEVVGRKLYITDFGREIAEASKRILQQVEEINHRTLAYKGELFGRLKISVVSTGKYVMPYFLSDFIKAHQGVDLVMDVTNKSKVLESLQNNETDFSLVSIIPAHLNVNRIDLMENKLYLIGKEKRHPKTPGDLSHMFDELPLIFREPGSGTRQVMEQFLASRNLKVTKKMELTSNEAVKQAILAGLGYSVMPLIGIRNELRKGALHIIPVKGLPVSTKWSLIWSEGKRLSPMAAAFAHYLEHNKKSVISKHFSELQEISKKQSPLKNERRLSTKS